ncbi:MAG TPA: iron-containing redox enzyme family protein [Polyangiales bacterium]|jgi:pyrroloquinoline quinone (PQQ) biosynthesis protein C|nr:iron-containing redox enzyme family protein [Polyangiales bacterium]
MSTTATTRFLNDLRAEIAAHPGVNHLFLQRLCTSPMAKQDYRVFAEHHFPLVCAFTSYLELLLLRAPDSESRLWLAKVLVDEYGEGSEGKDHATLYAKFLDATGGSSERQRGARVTAPAREFIRSHQELVRTRSFLFGLGAIGPGHEWAIPKMFESVIPGLRRAGFAEHEIGYFTLHVLQDDDHGAWLEEALARMSDNADARNEVRRGALASLDARGRFWDGVQNAVIRYRQPRAVRPDGPLPRSLLHEVLLTSWDGSKLGRAVDERLAARRREAEPTLPALLRECRRLA